DYMGALKKFTKQRTCESYIKMLQRAHEFSANVHDEEMDDMQSYLTACNAFIEDSEVLLKIVPR
ncbi:MAG: cell filamentation protein Fic, partial [Alphaproteobacteria bacterium]|nr:cell filamentation protein Fic [Alphaproteobacteria bacterium]